MSRTIRGFVLGLCALAAFTGCSPSKTTGSEATDRPTAVITAQPQDPQLARVTAEQVYNLLSGGDWAAAWDQWTTTAKTAITKEAYVDVVAKCPQPGTAFEITDVKSVNATTVTVIWRREKADGTAETGNNIVRYEDGTWRFEPDPAALAAYRKGTCG